MSATSELAVWDPVETLPRERLRELQLERLRATVERVLAGQPLGAARLAEAGVEAGGDVASLDDLARLPFSHKADLRDHYPFGLLAVPREQVVRVHASSGSHGKPTVVGYTRADLDAWAELMARCMTMAGVRARDGRAQRERLRAVHRRPRLPRRRRADRRDRRSRVGRLHGPAGDAAARPRRPGAGRRRPRMRW